MSRVIIASHNTGKVREIGELLEPLGYSAIAASKLSLPEPEETGLTFEENARIKALSALEHGKMPALADDSGLVIPALDGAPGIYSARWTGESKDYHVAFERIKRELTERGISPDSGISAHFTCVLCYAISKSKVHCFEGKVFGTLTFPPRGEKGFGYDPIFIPTGHDISFAEMPPEQKHGMSHRGNAFALLVEFLQAKE